MVSPLRASQGFSVAQIKAFVAAAESASLSKAAAKLGMSQPALSRCIKELEAALACDLFIRSSRGIGLSPAGQALYSRARNLVIDYGSMQEFVAKRRIDSRHTLRVAADASIAPVVLDKLQANLCKHAPTVQLQLSAMGSEEAVQEVLNAKADMGLCGAMEGQPRLRYTPVLSAPLGLIIPVGRDIPDSPQSLEEFASVPFVRLADYTPVTQTLRRHSVRFDAYFQSPIAYACLSAAFDSMRTEKMVAVATGIGASLPQVRDMRFMPLAALLPSLRVYLVSLRRQEVDDVTERLRDLVRLSVHESPWHPSVQRLNRIQPEV